VAPVACGGDIGGSSDGEERRDARTEAEAVDKDWKDRTAFKPSPKESGRRGTIGTGGSERDRFPTDFAPQVIPPDRKRWGFGGQAARLASGASAFCRNEEQSVISPVLVADLKT
jgi:hypothetical protein